MMTHPQTTTFGFSLVELLVVISIIGILASASIASLSDARAAARDTQRIIALKEIERALVSYKLDNRDYPANADSGQGVLAGWKVSYNPDFLAPLTPYLSTIPLDPINSGPPSSMHSPRPDGTYFFSYHRYPDGGYYGCDFDGPFAVITIRAFESGYRPDMQKAYCGAPSSCPSFIPNVCRDWSNEFDYSILLR